MGVVAGGVYDASGGWQVSLENLGVTDAPVTRDGLETALQFFAEQMPSLGAQGQFSFLKAMDLHRPVCIVTLHPPQVLAAYRRAGEDAFKLFYTKVGTSLHALGVNPDTRGFTRFRVLSTTLALESRCTSARDYQSQSLDGPTFSGGGLQYIVPNARMVLAQES